MCSSAGVASRVTEEHRRQQTLRQSCNEDLWVGLVQESIKASSMERRRVLCGKLVGMQHSHWSIGSQLDL